MPKDALTQYFGLEYRSLKLWSKKGIKIVDFYNKLKDCKTTRCQKDLFYETFRKTKTLEGMIDKAWSAFINHRIKIEDQKSLIKQRKKEIKHLAEEIKNGKKI
jgi:hypothetical protein